MGYGRPSTGVRETRAALGMLYGPTFTRGNTLFPKAHYNEFPNARFGSFGAIFARGAAGLSLDASPKRVTKARKYRCGVSNRAQFGLRSCAAKPDRSQTLLEVLSRVLSRNGETVQRFVIFTAPSPPPLRPSFIISLNGGTCLDIDGG